MELLIILAIYLIAFFVGLRWFFRIVRMFRKGETRKGSFHGTALLFIIFGFLWISEIFPLSKNVRIRREIENLTGKSFWPSNEFTSSRNWGIGGGGYSIDIYSFSAAVAEYFHSPDSSFFQRRTDQYGAHSMSFSGWQLTPVESTDAVYLEAATSELMGDSEKTLHHKKLIRQWAMAPGSLYANTGDPYSGHFFLINPEQRMFVLIYHNR